MNERYKGDDYLIIAARLKAAEEKRQRKLARNCGARLGAIPPDPDTHAKLSRRQERNIEKIREQGRQMMKKRVGQLIEAVLDAATVRD